MNKSIKYSIFLIIFLQIIFVYYLAFHERIYSWDEASYILNGKDIAGKATPLEHAYTSHERYPFLSWLVGSIFYLNLPTFLIYFIVPSCFVGLIVSSYFIGKIFFDKESGLYAALLCSISTIIFSNSFRILTDIPAAFFFASSLLFYLWGLKNRYYFFIGGLLGGISILTRESNALLVPVLLVFYLVYKKKIKTSFFLVSILILCLTITPYFIDNYLRWGDPLARLKIHSDMAKNGIGYTDTLAMTKLKWLTLLPQTISVPIVALCILFIFTPKNYFKRNQLILFAWFILFSIATILIFPTEPRYVVALILPCFIVSAKVLTKTSIIPKILILLILLMTNGFLFNIKPFYNNAAYSSAYNEAFSFINHNVPENDSLYTNNNPPSVIAIYSNRYAYYELNQTIAVNKQYYLISKIWYYPETLTTFLKQHNYSIIFDNSHFALYKKSSL